MSASMSKDLHVLGTVQMQTTRPVLASNCLQLTYERETIDESGLAKSTWRPGDSLAHSSALWFLSTPTTNLCRTISIAGKEVSERKWFGDHYKGLSTGDSNKHQEGQYRIKDASQEVMISFSELIKYGTRIPVEGLTEMTLQDLWYFP